jgi:hypothetical protein
VVSASDPSAVNLGVKFTTDTDGSITGIRFYKGAGNTGTHVGSLWTASGTLLGQVTFTSESATGWQEADFSSPIPVTAGTTYVASYLAPNGGYSYNPAAFTTVLGGQRRQRRLPLRRLPGVPHRHLQRHQLLGRRGLHHHVALARLSRYCRGSARAHSGDTPPVIRPVEYRRP